MKHDKYKIVFDSNIVFCNEENQLDKVFNSRIEEVFNFLKSNKITAVSLCVPKLVFDERVTQRVAQVGDQFLKMNSALRNLKIFGIINIKEKTLKKEKFQQKINENGLKTIKRYKIKVIPTANIEQGVLLQRALQKTAPFYGRGKGDKGFKDTLIWLSLLKDAKNKQGCNYILLTNDKSGFDQEICEKEFKEYSSADFFVIKELSVLKVFLDEKLGLDLELKELYHNIEQEILSLQGTITAEVGRYVNDSSLTIYSTRNAYLTNPTVSFLSDSLLSDEEGDGNFNFHSLDIHNISQEEDNQFNITADLYVTTKKSPKDTSSWRITLPSLYEDKILKYNISLRYKREFKLIEILSATKDV